MVYLATPSASERETPPFPQGLAVKSLEDINEPNLDPRLSLSRQGTEETALGRQLNDFVRKNEHDLDDSEKTQPLDKAIYVDFEEGDTRNPACFPRSKKWAITLLACYSTLIAASASSAYNMGFTSMTATVGFVVYTLGFGLVPLVSSSFSEEFGRQPLYIGSAVGFTSMYLLIALSKNIQTVIVARFIQGSFGSTWATMVGGTIADLWKPHERGLPMAIFSVAALGGTGVGPVVAGWVEMNPRLAWRWIQWIQMIICGVYSIIVPLVMRETRSSILLVRAARGARRGLRKNRRIYSLTPI
ncbi:major facilitator superfamily domain-containing protein [Mycena galericulata]|nr:major facilitator superfamily domain-containing protein [Mycena galericulata]